MEDACEVAVLPTSTFSFEACIVIAGVADSDLGSFPPVRGAVADFVIASLPLNICSQLLLLFWSSDVALALRLPSCIGGSIAFGGSFEGVSTGSPITGVDSRAFFEVSVVLPGFDSQGNQLDCRSSAALTMPSTWSLVAVVGFVALNICSSSFDSSFCSVFNVLVKVRSLSSVSF